jgi:hypothetical protein
MAKRNGSRGHKIRDIAHYGRSPTKEEREQFAHLHEVRLAAKLAAAQRRTYHEQPLLETAEVG